MKYFWLLPTAWLFASCADASPLVLKELKKADADLKNGSFTSTAKVYDADSKEVRHEKNVAIVHGSRFELLEENKDVKGRMTYRRRTVFDGQDRVSWIGRWVDIDRGSGDILSPTLALIDIQPGPSLYQGRGLSAMDIKKIQYNASSSLWILEAVAVDGSLIKAWLDPKARYLARKIERYSEKKLLSRTTTQGTQAGGLLPQRSVVSVPSLKLPHPSVYTFMNCEFPTKKPISFRGTFSSPSMIVDNRLGSAVTIAKKTNKPISKQELLHITEDQTQKLQQFKDAQNAAENRQLWMNRALMALPALLAALILFWRPRKKQVAPDA